MNIKANNRTPLIIGASGKTGKRVAERFTAEGLSFRAATRHSEIPFDWYDESTWPDALNGIGSIYLVFSPDLAIPAASDIIKNFVKQAESHGVEHIVLLSGRGETLAQACEKIVMDAQLSWTIVRSSWFAQNFSESFFLDDILRGQVFLPVGGVKEPFIDVQDIADVVFAALTDEKHRGQIYEVTGPELLSFSDAINQIGEAANRNITFQQIPMQDYANFMTDAQIPEDHIALIKYLFTEVLDGRNASLTDGVKRALGREPRKFNAYANATSETGVWVSSEPASANA